MLIKFVKFLNIHNVFNDVLKSLHISVELCFPNDESILKTTAYLIVDRKIGVWILKLGRTQPKLQCKLLRFCDYQFKLKP